MPQVCFHCKQIGHVKRLTPLFSGSSFVGQSFSQHRAPVQGFGQATVQPIATLRSEVRNSLGAQRSQARA